MTRAGVARRRTRCDLPLRARLGRFAAAVGLSPRYCCLPAAPATAQDGERASGRHDPGPRLDESVWQTALVVGFEVVHPQLRPAGRLRPGPGARAGLRRVVGAVRGRPDLDVQDPRRHALVGWRRRPRPRTPAGRIQFVLDAIASEEGFIGLGYIDPYAANAGSHRVEAPRIRRRWSSRPGPSERPDPQDVHPDPAQAHLGARSRLAGDRRLHSADRDRSSAPARTRPSSGRPASSSGSRRTPTTGRTPARPTRSSSSSSRAPRTRWSRRSAPASSTTPVA